MRKRIFIVFIGICIMFGVVGCRRISNEKITIKQYKGLQVEISNESVSTEDEFEEKMWETLLEQCEVKKIPQDKIDLYTEEIIEQYRYRATMYGKKPEELIEQDYGVAVEEVVKKKICKELAIELIAETEKIVVTAQEYDKGLKKIALKYQFENPKDFENFVGKENVKQKLLQDKVTEFLVNNCKQ